MLESRSKSSHLGRRVAKTLFYKIVQQTQLLAAIASVDASNCYDQIAHAMALLIFQSFGVEDMALATMLETIQEMIFFLRTAYEDSTNFGGSMIEVKTARFGSGQRGIPGRLVRHQHNDPMGTWKERPWCTICCSDVVHETEPVCHPIR